MRKTAATIFLAFGGVLLVAGAAFAISKVCPDNCRGTAGDDRLGGNARANTIYAEDGNDRVLGRGGEDALKGGDGRDEVYGQEGNNRVKGSAGMDRVYGGPGDDLVRGGIPERPDDGASDVLDCDGDDCKGTNNANTMNGSPQDDRMLALEGADTLYGLGGMDALEGKGGGDRIFGGESNDLVRGGTHSVANDHARDLLICGPGRDKVFFVRGQDALKGCEVKRPSN